MRLLMRQWLREGTSRTSADFQCVVCAVGTEVAYVMSYSLVA